jgi:hypothetical protein
MRDEVRRLASLRGSRLLLASAPSRTGNPRRVRRACRRLDGSVDTGTGSTTATMSNPRGPDRTAAAGLGMCRALKRATP